MCAQLEEGEILDPIAKKRAARKVAEEERKARKRMLGNIQFIGHLYKSKLLTEKIMHSCIIALLQVRTGFCAAACRVPEEGQVGLGKRWHSGL